MKDLERIFKAFANKRRLAVLQYLKKNKEASVGDISEEIGLSFKSTSRHLAVLSGIDILDKDQRGLMVYYKIAQHQKIVAKYILSLL